MSESIWRCRDAAILLSSATTLDGDAAPRPPSPYTYARRRLSTFPRGIDLLSLVSHDCSAAANAEKRSCERVVGGNKPFIETLSGDQEHEEAIRHLLPLYECRPLPLLIAVAPHRLAFGTYSFACPHIHKA